MIMVPNLSIQALFKSNLENLAHSSYWLLHEREQVLMHGKDKY